MRFLRNATYVDAYHAGLLECWTVLCAQAVIAWRGRKWRDDCRLDDDDGSAMAALATQALAHTEQSKFRFLSRQASEHSQSTKQSHDCLFANQAT